MKCLGLGIIIISITLARFAGMPEGRGALHHSADAAWQLRGGEPLTVQSVTEMHTHQTSTLSCPRCPIYLEVTEAAVINEERKWWIFHIFFNVSLI